ncbi:MAG: hypothetical protein ACRENY_04630 [Candidatus Dormibacteria bacterium]
MIDEDPGGHGLAFDRGAAALYAEIVAERAAPARSRNCPCPDDG